MNPSIPLFTILAILAAHFVFDWLLQTDWMALNKSSDNKALSVHVGVYSIGLFLLALLLPGVSFIWAAANAVAHWITDYFTSRVAGSFYKQEKRGAFFNTIGLDQFIHMVTLFGTLTLL